MNERVKQIRSELNMTQSEFAQLLGIGKTALSMIETGKTGLSARNRQILIQKLNVNPDWLIDGRGAMFNDRPSLQALSETLQSPAAMPMQSIPIYALDLGAGFSALLQQQESLRPINYLHIPNLPKCDGAIYASGNSMSPIVESGDIILYKRQRSLDDLFYGELYLLSFDVDGEEYTTLRYVTRGSDAEHVRLETRNERFPDKEIAVGRIRAIALVQADIRISALR